MKKFLGVMLVLFLSLTLVSVAQAQDAFEFGGIEVNNENVLGTNTVLYVERGDVLDIRVALKANENVNDVRIKAYLGGYEYGTIEQDSEIVKVDVDSTKVVSLRIKVPEDIDASRDKTLYVEAYNDDDNVEEAITLRLQERRHFINLYDVFINPGLTVKDYLSVSVVLENLGDCLDSTDCDPEKNIIVEASLPQLGMSVRDSVDKLYPDDLEDDDEDDTSKDSTAKVNLPIMDLTNVPSGEYELRVRAYYNRNHDYTEEVYTLSVQNGEAEDVIVNADATSKDVTLDSTVTYEVNVANLGDTERTFLVSVEGTNTLGSVTVAPRTVTVLPGTTQNVLVTLNVKEDAVMGQQLFSVKFLENGELVKELNLDANVVEDTSKDSFILGLKIVAVVLLVILIILGVIVAVTRGKDDEGDFSAPEVPPSPSKEEGSQQTYY